MRSRDYNCRRGDYSDPVFLLSNFEFIGDDGSVNEVDALAITRAGLFLLELKSRGGSITGNRHTWFWEKDGRTVTIDSPLILTNRKAKKLGDILARQKAFRASPLLDGLESGPVDDREWIADTLGRIGDDRALQPLVACLECSPQRGGYQAVLDALHRLGFHFRVDARVKSAVMNRVFYGDLHAAHNYDIATIRQLGAAAVPDLVACLHEGDANARRMATWALAELGADSWPAVPFIGELWRRGELWYGGGNSYPDNLGLLAFSKIGHPRCLQYVIPSMFDDPSRLARVHRAFEDEIVLLGKMGPRAGLPPEAPRWIALASGYDLVNPGYDKPDEVSLERSDDAVRALCSIQGRIIDNILHLVLKKAPLEIDLSNETFTKREVITFWKQRDVARRELRKRGNPPYDPVAFSGC